MEHYDQPSSTRYICIHGHFYQPPRENPWLETVETQDSAAPYHDWNERVTAECYAPNGAARIVNSENRIIRILNNYGRISFNFGPTLLSWLEANAGRVYRAILDADANSQKRFGGHGSAMAQVYNHVILPLASTRDRITQIRWGIADFEQRFQRRPEGMWLPETAVDTESLELLAAEGIKFVVLAPHQCARVRSLGDGEAVQLTFENAGDPEEQGWIETPDASVDSTRPYFVRLKDNRSIAVFFYDGPRSRAIAFEGLLNSGEAFVQRLLEGFSETSSRPQLVHVATDGESYGHHHRYGEMALAWALQRIEEEGYAKLTNYGQFLEKFPPEYEAEIAENTSWSCAHGVERWRSDCGCNGGHAGWNQQWRARPLAGQCGPAGQSAVSRTVSRSGCRSQRVHRCNSRSRKGGCLPHRPHSARPFPRWPRLGIAADGVGTQRHADVHKLRLVFRRNFWNRNGAGRRLRGPRAPSRRKTLRRKRSSA
jgi:alpha-amylase/alpha-mannosidase (GH57 family)